MVVRPTSVTQLDQAIDALAKPVDASIVEKTDEIQRGFAGMDTVYAR